MNLKKWEVSPVQKENAQQIAQTLGVPYFLGMLLDIRGVRSPEDARAFFEQSDSAFSDPMTFADMATAAERILQAIENGERIAVFGDYDADGVTATAMLFSYLESAGADVCYYIPDRESEGYGMNKEAVKKLSDGGVSLIVTVDNGVSAIEEVEYAASLSVDVVVTDHHRPREVLPDAVAVVDPHRVDCPSRFKEFAGVGVAFKLITALEGEYADVEALLANYADLIAIGTIGDVVSLTGENRALVQAGLHYMAHTDRIGLRSLLERCDLLGKPVTASSVAFGIVPRINATGRMDTSRRAVELLLCEDPEQADRLAEEVCRNNDLRRAIETDILEKSEILLRREPERLNERILIVEGEDWHHGVIGIVAARLVDKYGKPCLVLSCSGDEVKGSGRSVEGLSLFEVLHHNGELLTKYGGHPMAAGFSMMRENLPEFRRAVCGYASAQKEVPAQTVHLDCKLRPGALSVEIPRLLRCLEPYGTDNPLPQFGLFGVTLKEITPVGNGKHLRLEAEKQGHTEVCMLFGVTMDQFPYNRGDVVDLAVQLSAREFRGEETLSIVVREIRAAGLNDRELIDDYAVFEKYKRKEALGEMDLIRLMPRREEFAAVYRMLQKNGGWNGHTLMLLKQLEGEHLHLSKLLVILQAMRELKLIACRRQGERLLVALLPVQGKADLFSAPILQEIERLGKGGDAHVEQ